MHIKYDLMHGTAETLETLRLDDCVARVTNALEDKTPNEETIRLRLGVLRARLARANDLVTTLETLLRK